MQLDRLDMQRYKTDNKEGSIIYYPYLYFKLILLRYNFGLNIINFLLLKYYYYLIILIKIKDETNFITSQKHY